MIDQIIPKADCTGCKTCADVCPKAAIRYETDAEGFWRPVVRDDLCVRCGLCVERCPVLTPLPTPANHSAHPAAYAAFAKNDALRHTSTSGGVFGVLAEAVIARGGCVAGAAFDENNRVHHVFAETPEALEALRGVKYVQSDTAEIYRDTKARLDRGKTVLFAGTTCQNAALAAYLGREYENLYLCDFICHGVPSPGAFESYRQSLEKRYGPLRSIRFRDKSSSWAESGVRITFADGTERFEKGMENAWTKAYLQAKALVRQSCFACRFKTLPRISDLTLADFWGAPGNLNDTADGISAVLVNSQKGQALLRMAEPDLVLEKSDVDTVYRGNACLLKSTVPGAKREAFLLGLEKTDFSDMLDIVLRPTLAQRARAKMNMAKKALRGKKTDAEK